MPERVTRRGFRHEPAGATATSTARRGAATPARGAIETANARDLAQAVAIVAKAAFDEARDAPHAVRS